ncbi:Sensory transduction protein regX3 [Clostridioides difficile]|nr:Sensory transduction protein regX3 [Clostridioides difficile]
MERIDRMNSSILVIEDDSNIQELISEFLSAEGYQVESANDGLEGIQKFKQGSYDLVILDIMMPNLDGYGVCKMIRKSSSVPIIFLTALNDEGDQLKGFDLECDDYITKPFSFNLLIKRVEAILRRSNKTINDKFIVFEKLKLDLNTYIAEIDGEPIELTLKEFNILKALIEKYPQVITREGLLDSIWGYDYYGDTRIVDAHIKNIRKKISLPYIKTVKGIGYTLEKDI